MWHAKEEVEITNGIIYVLRLQSLFFYKPYYVFDKKDT